MTTATATEPTLVTFLLDRSSSMGSCWDATIEGFNGYIEELKKATTPISFTFLQFDHNTGCEIKKVHFEKPIQDVPPIDKKSYQPRGSTPLIEAATKTIAALATAVAQKAKPPKVIVCIQTDGEENMSAAEYTWQRLKDLIAEYTAKGWHFVFMGAGIDAYDQGSKMGISAANTMSYDHTHAHTTRAAFAGTASNSANVASGLSSTMAYSMSQRASSGDAHAHRVFNTPNKPFIPPATPHPLDLTGTTHVVMQTPVAPVVVHQPLDLTTGGSHSVTTKVDVLDLTQ